MLHEVTTWMVDVQGSILKSLRISHDVTKWMVTCTESFHDQGAHCACARASATRDISSDVPVKYDTRRYLNSLKGMI